MSDELKVLWWAVIDPHNQPMLITRNEQEARDGLRDGDTLERMVRRVGQVAVWEKVT